MSRTEENDRRIASDVLGAIKKPQATGDYYVDLATASAPLVQEGTVVRACCLGCGNCLELLKGGADYLAKLADAQKPDSWEGCYFEAQRCPICDRDYRQVTLKHTRDLPP